ncbi:MAG: response regulator [Proteobacteria bacterium]|nr:response regulator [Pseudomonadota bacterium]
MKKRRILFVDDEPKVLEAFQMMLSDKSAEWDMEFVTSGQQALERLSQAPFDAIISDIVMPDMDGHQLMNEVRNIYPHLIRIALSGHSEEESIMKLALAAHQYLSKPCDPEILKSTIKQEFVFQDLLIDDPVRHVISKIDRLPSMPSLYSQITAELKHQNTSVLRVANIIARDIGMTAKVLQLVNSAFFALSYRVSNLVQAVSLLGLDTIKTLVLTIHIFSQFDPAEVHALDISRAWNHSLRVGLFAKTIAKIQNQNQVVIDECLTAGILHDVGKSILAYNFPKEYKEIRQLAKEEGIPIHKAESKVLNSATHAEVGGYLIGLWGLPNIIAETVQFHHNFDRTDMKAFSALGAVQIANVLEYEIEETTNQTETTHQEEREFFASSMWANKLDEWRKACQAITENEVY